MSDGTTRRADADRPFPAARPVSPDISLSRGERRARGAQWSTFVWVSVAAGGAFLALVVGLMLFGPR